MPDDFASDVTSFKYGGSSTSLAQELAGLNMTGPGQTFTFTYATIEFSGLPSGLIEALEATSTLTLSNTDASLRVSAVAPAFLDVTDSAAAPPSAPIPEPAGWALMIAGSGLAGASLRRRRRPLAAAGC
jgi:hypothetical protein